MALEIFVPNTGQGDCTFVKFPNGKNMLIDVNRTEVDVDILEFLRAKIPERKHSDINKSCRRLNYLVNTHPHNDHIRGIGFLGESEFYIDNIWESGHRLYVPKEQKDDYKDYYNFLDLISKLKKRDSVKICKASSVPINIGASEIYFFSPTTQIVDSSSGAEVHDQCLVMKIVYSGNSILFAGDSSRLCWENNIFPKYSDKLKSTVLHASHHGSKYCFVSQNDDDDRFTAGIEEVHPSFTIISVGKGNSHGHPHRIALNIYKECTKYKRIYTTKDNSSMYFAFKNNGETEYIKDLKYDDLISIKHKKEDDASIRKSTAMTFIVDKEIELELPKRPPKPKREGYFKNRI